jgi:hypothetical protein
MWLIQVLELQEVCGMIMENMEDMIQRLQGIDM